MNNMKNACLRTKSGDAVMLKGIAIEGDCRGLLFEATVVQRYTNPTARNMEVIYNFPLPYGAVLLGVDVILGGKPLSGSVVAKNAAEAKYEEALAEGDAAIMLEVTHDGGYCMNLGNLAAKEDCNITLRYAQTLNFEQGGLRLMIPTVIAPRYGNAVKAGGFAAHQTYESDLTAEYPFDVTLRLHGDLANTRVASPSHPVSVESSKIEDDSLLTITLARQGALDRDFVLVVDRLAHSSIAVTAPDYAESGKFVTLASLCPTAPGASPKPISMKILVDCSGSMAGDSINEAMEALMAVVDQLSAEDRFSLSRFGDTVVHRSRALWPVTPTTKLAAGRWVGQLDADLGGTEMESALSSTIKLGDGTASDILLVTDGEIHGIDSLIETARKSHHRVFVVGIGSSPAEVHLRRLAEATGGGCDFVASGEPVQPAILRMFARLRSPRFTGLKLLWPDGTEVTWSTPLNTAVFTGDTLNIFAWVNRAPAGRITLTGYTEQASEPIEIASASVGAPSASPALSRLAASARLRSLQANSETSASDENEMAGLAVAYQLVTPFSNFLLVHERAEGEKATEMPELVKVAQMVPAGWGGTGRVLSSGGPIFRMAKRMANVSACYDINVPNLVRSPRTQASDLMQAREAKDMEHYDIPAFLRRDITPAFNAPDDIARPREIDSGNAKFWIREQSYVGMTPLGVAELLRINPQEIWPASYDDYSKIELGGWVLDWLEFAIGNGGSQPIDEKTVVAAFNHVMGQPETFRYLNKKIRRDQWVEAITASLADQQRAHHPAIGTAAGIACVKLILGLLATIQPQDWPAQVIGLSKDVC